MNNRWSIGHVTNLSGNSYVFELNKTFLIPAFLKYSNVFPETSKDLRNQNIEV